MNTKELYRKRVAFVREHQRTMYAFEQLPDKEKFDAAWSQFIETTARPALNYSGKTHWMDIRRPLRGLLFRGAKELVRYPLL